MIAVGLVVLLYDHVLTFADEVRLVWLAPRSLAKYAFLLERYLVLGTLLCVACELCGFVGDVFTDTSRCKHFIFIASMIAVISIGIINMLVMLRVVILWDERPAVLKLMVAVYLTSLFAQTASIIVALLHLLPGITWSSIAGMCVASNSTRVLVAVWASPMLFELFVLVSTAWNALDRPTSAQTPLTKALHSDGILYFVSVALFRALNVALSVISISRPSFTLLGVFFVWAMTTTIVNRSLLQFRVKRGSTQESIVLIEHSVSTENLRLHGERSDGSNINISKLVEVTEDVSEVDEMWASRRRKRPWRNRA
ncbi:hypothetical protein FOMPIDRAFT_46296 [Fomitopsis schrenkii]|uniref:DUF6533 domain-containing protein n=1 Tax=Fomitopsis schrenkii TaxID=2126942 RepID=S8EL87_FOMSC|nr:hypothetical protein FOMPIDRAFT_46296 [Fomitopsis schrenkii]